jgi:hypothetical protein
MWAAYSERCRSPAAAERAGKRDVGLGASTSSASPRWPVGVLRRLLDEDAALLAVYVDVPLGDVENRRG